jgi:SnoaL-like domain
MTPLDTLVAIEAISRTKAEYFRCIDEQDWEGLVRIFTPDAETDMREAVEPHNPDLLDHDPSKFAANNAFVLAGVRTAHFGYMPRIDVLSEDEARAVWSMEDWLWVPEGNPVMPAGRMHGWGHYHDRYRRVDGRWLIAATRLTRIKIEFE